MTNSEKVINFRRRIKKGLVNAFDNKCALCGKTYCDFVYDFHHIDPKKKSFGIGSQNTTKSKSEVVNEAKKCVMLCANCHRIVEHSGENFSFVSNFKEEVFYQTIEDLIKKNPKSNPTYEDKKKAHSRKPDRNTLKKLVREKPMLQVGKMFEVSDNAIRKWCISYNLPHRKIDINSYSDEEWENI